MLGCNGHTLEEEREGVVVMCNGLLTPANITEQTESSGPRAPEVSIKHQDLGAPEVSIEHQGLGAPEVSTEHQGPGAPEVSIANGEP